MPELPEVETTRHNLVRWLHGRRVVKAEAEDTRLFRGAHRRGFSSLHGRLLELERRGKYLLFTFEGGRGLLAHLGMTGRFVRRAEGDPVPFTRARLHLDSGDVLHYADARLLGRLEPCAASRLHALTAVKALGRDPLVDGLSAAQLEEAVGPSRQPLKVALMDQGRVAGLGNIQAAEALHRARLHPARAPGSLSGAEWKALARAIHATLAFTLRGLRGEELQYLIDGAHNDFHVYGRAGTPCPRCGAKVRSLPQAGRTTHYCPRCQPPHPGRAPVARRRRAAAQRR